MTMKPELWLQGVTFNTGYSSGRPLVGMRHHVIDKAGKVHEQGLFYMAPEQVRMLIERLQGELKYLETPHTPPPETPPVQAIPLVCGDCGASFPSALGLGPRGSAVLQDISEICPQCKRQVPFVDGAYEFTNGVLSIIRGLPADAIPKVQAATREAEAKGFDKAALADIVDKVSPPLAGVIRAAPLGMKAMAIIGVIVWACHSCSVSLNLNASWDVNKTMDHIFGGDSKSLPKPSEQSPPGSGLHVSGDTSRSFGSIPNGLEKPHADTD